jgi:hypothetical protein
MKLTDCYYERKDWRACKKEVSAAVFTFLEVRGHPLEHPRSCRAAIAACGIISTRRFEDQVLIGVDGDLSRMLETSQQRSEDGD